MTVFVRIDHAAEAGLPLRPTGRHATRSMIIPLAAAEIDYRFHLAANLSHRISVLLAA